MQDMFWCKNYSKLIPHFHLTWNYESTASLVCVCVCVCGGGGGGGRRWGVLLFFF